MRPRLGRSRGMGLVLSLMSIVVFVIVTTGIIFSVRQLKREGVYQAGLLEAQNIAESCAQDALLQLQQNAGWHTGFSGKSFADGYYDATVNTSVSTRPVVNCTGFGPSVGLLGRPFRTVSFTVEFFPVTAINGSFTSQQTDSKTSGSDWTYMDSYNSQSDPNAASRTSTAQAAANGNMSLYNSAGQVMGSAIYWSGSAPSCCGASEQVTVSVTHSSSTFPTFSAGAYATVNNNNSGGLVPSSIFNGTDLIVPVGTNATITSGVYYVRDFKTNYTNGSNLGTLTVKATNGPVVVYVTRTMDIEGDLCNPTLRPGNLWIIGVAGANQTFKMFPTYCAFYGVVEGNYVQFHLDYVMYGAVETQQFFLEDLVSSQMPWIGILHQDQDLQTALNWPRIVPGSWQYLSKKY